MIIHRQSRSSTHDRVVITGMGAVTALGTCVEESWTNLVKGISGISRYDVFDPEPLPCKVAAQVDLKKVQRQLASKTDNRLPSNSRSAWFAWKACLEAWSCSGLHQLSPGDNSRVGLHFASSTDTLPVDLVTAVASHIPDHLARHDLSRQFREQCFKKMEASSVSGMICGTTEQFLAKQFRIGGPVIPQLTACASSTQSIADAFHAILRDECDVVLAGGSDSRLSPLYVLGYCLLGAVTRDYNDTPLKASRPFDLHRSGFVIGEGSGALVLERLSHALDRGATIYGEIAGAGVTSDAFRLTDPHPDARGALAAMRLAMQNAGISRNEIDYVNAHGTSTKANDLAETKAIQEVFGEQTSRIPVSSCKSMIGHLAAASGAVETIFTILALKQGTLPPTTNLEEPDPECNLNHVANAARHTSCRAALKNSFGFGGQNASLVIKRWES